MAEQQQNQQQQKQQQEAEGDRDLEDVVDATAMETIEAITMGDKGETTVVPTVDELVDAMKQAAGGDERMFNTNAVEEQEGLVVLAFLHDGIQGEQKFPPLDWLRLWGFIGGETTVEDSGSAELTLDTEVAEKVPPMLLKPVELRFGQLWKAAEAGECDEWELYGNSAILALIILLDTITRVFKRDTAAAFKNDPTAVALADAIWNDKFEEGNLMEQIFLCLPFIHSEKVKFQEKALKRLEELEKAHPKAYGGFLVSLQTAVKNNMETLTRFGRFPQRNSALRRKSSDEEKEFLETKLKSLAIAEDPHE